MKPLILTVFLLFTCGSLSAQKTGWQTSPGRTQTPIWPGTPPDARFGPPVDTETTKPGEVENVSRPTMTVYSPKGKNTGVAVVVFPGGGYFALAIDLEGTEVCDWLTSKGITCVLLKYRVPYSGPHWDKQCNCQKNPKAPMALEDAQRTVGLVRFHAAERHINPHKIGVLGFSAGGHLVADISTHFDKRSYSAVDAADKASCRPDFAVALYPGHLWLSSYKKFELNPDVPVTRQTPPTFLLQAENDPVDSVNNSLVYYVALKKAGVPVEMHLYAEGKHAFGLRPTKFPITRWPELVETWLRTIGMISE
jgi:acetyl esterase/lipase